ncbi:hypothetical protein [Novosphingobium sp.]|uniref:hypothetical protein n=1 Tax=Novosphingobium sp. TaxID=1874826 RepID=UPI00286E962B|nr:hypothetical protein [Novosphingobium sp.]
MNWGSPEFVILIVAISTGGWVINNWIRARHGYPLEDEWGGKTAKGDDKASKALIAENAELRAQLSKVGERLQVLERIATDSSVGVAAQIEALRDEPRVTAKLEKEVR